MKKIKLLLIAFLAMLMTANVFGQSTVTVPVQDRDKNSNTTFKNPHIVAKGSSYTYSVNENFTKTLEQLLRTGENGNRYEWELFEITDVTITGEVPIDHESGKSITYTIGNSAGKSGEFETESTWSNEWGLRWSNDGSKTGFENINIEANPNEDKYYLLRVMEYPNHGEESIETDRLAVSVSEIVIKIGDEIQIFIDDEDGEDGTKPCPNAYYCDGEYGTADADGNKELSLAELDTDAGKIKLKFNGRPIVAENDTDPMYKFNFTVKHVTKGTDGVLVNEDYKVTYELKKSEAPVDGFVQDEDGYYTFEVGMEQLNRLQTTAGKTLKILTTAADADRYYRVTLDSFVHGDNDDANPTEAVVDAEKGKKKIREYGFYTKTKVSKIEFK